MSVGRVFVLALAAWPLLPVVAVAQYGTDPYAQYGQTGGYGTPSTPPATPTPGSDEDVDLAAGGHVGYVRLDEHNFVAPVLAADIRLYFLQAAVRIPLRFRLDTGDIREQDWDEAADFFRLGQCVRFDLASRDEAESRLPMGARAAPFERERGNCQPWDMDLGDTYFSVRLGRFHDFMLGTGTILRSFSNDLNPDHFLPGLMADIKVERYITARFILDNVASPGVMGGSFTFAPVGSETPAELLVRGLRRPISPHQLAIEGTVVADLQAPDRVRTAFGLGLVDAQRNLLTTVTPLLVVGANLQYIYQLDTEFLLGARADLNWITGFGMGGHAQAGAIIQHPQADWRLILGAEGRLFQGNYVPTYFDSYYQINSQQYTLTDGLVEQLGGQRFVTKREFLESLDPDDWRGGYQAGFRFELRSGTPFVDQRVLFFAQLYAGDNIERDNDGEVTLTIGVPRLSDAIDIYALYSRQSIDSFGDLFELDDTLVKLHVRWDLLRGLMYVLLEYGRIWQVLIDQESFSTLGFTSENVFNISLGFEAGIAGRPAATHGLPAP